MYCIIEAEQQKQLQNKHEGKSENNYNEYIKMQIKFFFLLSFCPNRHHRLRHFPQS